MLKCVLPPLNLNRTRDLLDRCVDEYTEIWNKEREAQVEFMLRYQIDKPIKGEITIGKLRYRGIKSIAEEHITRKFLGIVQRGQLIKFDPMLYQFHKQKDKVFAFGSARGKGRGIINQIC